MIRPAPLAHRLPGLALTALGVAALLHALSLPFGTITQPDTGFHPTLVCLSLLLFGGLATLDPDEPPAEDAPLPGAGWRIAVMVAGIAVFALVLDRAGYLASMCALLLLITRTIGGARWSRAVPASMLGSVLSYLVFTRLGMPLPRGLLGF